MRNASIADCGLRITNLILLFLTILLAFAATAANAADWTMWGGTPARNMVSAEKNLPTTFSATLASTAPSLWPALSGITGPNLRWAARLATKSYSTPVVSGGKVFIGANSETHYDSRRAERGGGSLLCFDEKTGRYLWQLIRPRYLTSNKLFNYDNIAYGILSTPVVEGNRLYIVSNRDELLCLDTEGQANGNDGPFQYEATAMVSTTRPVVKLKKTDGDIIWRLDMLTDPDIFAWVQDADDCSILVLGDYLYVCPSNGVDHTHKHIPHPECPSLIVVDKHTGKLIARDDAKIGSRFFHGEWSSASTGVVNGRQLIFWGGGDGVVYALDAKPTPPAPGERLGRLPVVWSFDVNAAGGRVGAYRTPGGPSEIIATPVFYNNRVYVDVGQDPTHGPGRGALACIDATKTGDVTKTGAIWVNTDIDRSLSTVAIDKGLLYTADNNKGRIFCLDADTGKKHWMFQSNQQLCSSPLIADGKVYIGNDGGNLFVFEHNKEMKLINKIHLDSSIEATPTAANGTLYVATLHYLYAAALK